MNKRKSKLISFLFIFIIIFSFLLNQRVYANTTTENNGIIYKVHARDIGWMDWVSQGKMAGTTGRSLRMEAIQINNNNPDFKITYQVHVKDIGWMDWVNQGEIAGTTGKSLRMEAIRIRIHNYNTNVTYRVKYRVHVRDIGWMDWVNQGEIAGTTGRSLRIEAIEINIEKENVTNSTPITKIKNGIDVSTYQGKINWQSVKQAGVDYAMIRAGYRGYGISADGTDGKLVKDARFVENVNGAINAGLDVGVYFFTQAINEKEAIEEANFVLNLVKNYKITYPIAIDTELSTHPTGNGRADKLSKEERTNIIKAFCRTIEEAGYKTMIYANKWWLNDNLDMSKLSNYIVWLAHYTGAVQSNPLLKPSDYKGNYDMWQYTDKGRVNGIDGNVDMNIKYE